MEDIKKENEMKESRDILDKQEIPEPEEFEYQPTEEDRILAARIAERKRRAKKKRIRNKYIAVFSIIAALVLMLTMCGRQVIRLKAENYALQKQQKELIEERDRLAEELKHTGDKDYIKDQARKQLKLLDPGEIMFIFKDGEDETEDGE